MNYRGDFDQNAVIYIPFTTVDANGAPAALTAGSIAVYAGASTTESNSGITLTASIDSRTGMNLVAITTASSASFYTTATDFYVAITAGSVSTADVKGYVVGSFSIRNRAHLYPTTAGRTLVVDSAGLADANTVKLGPTGSGTAQTARDIGLSVLLSNGTGTGQLSFTSGVVSANVTQAGGSAIDQSGGLLNCNVKQISTDATAADNLEAILDGTGGASLSLSSIVVTGGVTITQSVTNGHGISVTGNGTGSGIQSTSGSGAGASALNLVAAGTGQSHGLQTVGAAQGAGARIASGTTSGATPAVDIIAGTGSNTHGIRTTGDGNGHGIRSAGGATGIGMALLGGGTSGNGLDISTTSGHGVSIAPVGSSKHGISVTGGNGGTSDGISAVAGTGGVPIRGDITGNVTGNLVGNVTGNVTGNVGGTVTGLASTITNIQSDTDDIQSRLPAALTAGGNMKCDALKLNGATPENLSAAQVNTEVDTALSDIQLNYLVHDPMVIDFATDVNADSMLGALAQPVTDSFDRSTDSIAAIVNTIKDSSNSVYANLTAASIASLFSSIMGTSIGTESYAGDGVQPTLKQILYMILQNIQEFSISGTTITVKKLDGSTTAMTYTLDSSSSPTSRTRTT